MATFKYVGESPNGAFPMYGQDWKNGSINDVTDEVAIRKLSGNRFFERIDAEVTIEQPKKKGKGPRKEVAHDDAVSKRAIESGDGEAGDP